MHHLAITFCQVKAKAKGAVFCLCLSFLMLSLSGCTGAWVSGRPIYPGSWPMLDAGRECPNLSGKYRAVSDEAAPLVYMAGDHPREVFLSVTYGKPLPVPPLGRRILPWHLAGASDRGDQEEWNLLTAYAETLEAEAIHSSQVDGGGWVELQQVAESAIEVRAGLHDGTLLDFVLRKEGQGLWTTKSHVYKCEQGGIVVLGSFPPPPEENPTGQKGAVGAKFTFFRAKDGSLVALEEAYTGVAQGNMIFNKWWRWRRIE